MKMNQMLKTIVVIAISIAISTGVSFADLYNVALNADVTLHGGQFFYWGGDPGIWTSGYEVSPDTIVDGVFLPRGNQWDQDPVWWVVRYGNPDCWIEIDLGNITTIESFVVQADDNDGYELYYWDIGNGSWQLAWDVPNYDTWGWGMQTRPNPDDDAELYILPSPIVTNKLKFKGTLEDGDLGFAVSEIQAYGEEVVLGLSGWVFLAGGSSDIGYSLDEDSLLYFYASEPILTYNITIGEWVPDGPVDWIYMNWPFVYDLDTDTLMFILPPESGLWVYHFSTGEWTVLPRIIP